MKLSDIIAIWDILHIKNTGDIGFCDLADAIKQTVGEEIDIATVDELNSAGVPTYEGSNL